MYVIALQNAEKNSTKHAILTGAPGIDKKTDEDRENCRDENDAAVHHSCDCHIVTVVTSRSVLFCHITRF